ncbi:hypothetical protein [Streptomyces sp. NPDC055749]
MPESTRLEYTSFKPGDESAPSGSARESIGGTATIGLLYEHTDREKRGQYRFDLTWDQPTMSIDHFHDQRSARTTTYLAGCFSAYWYSANGQHA